MIPRDSSRTLCLNVVIPNVLGMHARSAAQMARISMRARGRVWVSRDQERVDATSIIDLLTLACPQGTHITLAVEDPADLPVLQELVALVENGFGE
jgi:phosphocarrier protein